MRVYVFVIGSLALVACARGGGRPEDGGGGLDAASLEDAGEALDAAPPLDDGAARDDAAMRSDAGPPVACTAETAEAVCGGRSCVDGYCCESTCDDACGSCGLAGREGTCSIDEGALCDDEDPCTHGETCDGAGACGAGTRLSCDAMDTSCVDYACDGTASCASSPRVDEPCDDGDDGTSNDRCQADGRCAGTPAGCALPSDACATGAQSRDRCSGAQVIGRAAADDAAGYVVTADTCAASNRFDDCAWDAGNDHAYRIWLRAGETVSVQLSRTDTCSSGYSATLKLYQSTGCTDITCGTDLWCRDFVGTSPETYVAPRDGWVVIVVDGSTAFDDDGRYTMTVRLTGCAAPGCEC